MSSPPPKPSPKPPLEPDLETIEACRRREPAALDRVLRAQLPALEALLARLLGPDSEREDVLQQVLTAVITRFPEFRGESKVRTWITGIAINTVHRHWRQPHRRGHTQLEHETEQTKTLGPGAARADQREGVRRLYGHLEAIAPRKRIAFVLHVLEGRPIEEVARLTNASLSATKSRIFHARKELRRRAERDPVLSSIVGDKER